MPDSYDFFQQFRFRYDPLSVEEIDKGFRLDNSDISNSPKVTVSLGSGPGIVSPHTSCEKRNPTLKRCGVFLVHPWHLTWN
jgi:hypothetical protein